MSFSLKKNDTVKCWDPDSNQSLGTGSLVMTATLSQLLLDAPVGI